MHFVATTGKLCGNLPTADTRLVTIPNYFFFLFVPLGVGKSPPLRSNLPQAIWKNLLPLLGDASQFQREIEALPAGQPRAIKKGGRKHDAPTI